MTKGAEIVRRARAQGWRIEIDPDGTLHLPAGFDARTALEIARNYWSVTAALHRCQVIPFPIERRHAGVATCEGEASP